MRMIQTVVWTYRKCFTGLKGHSRSRDVSISQPIHQGIVQQPGGENIYIYFSSFLMTPINLDFIVDTITNFVD